MRNTQRWYTGGILVLVAAALFLRVWGAGWSLPYVDHPDEPAVVKAVLRIVNGSINPKHFFYPSLIIYLQALVFKIHFWWGAMAGLYSESLTLPDSTHFYTPIPHAFFWARIATALLGTTTVVTLATWGARAIGRREALLAAAFLAWSAWAIVHDHYITVDGPSALFSLLALLGAVQILRHGSWRDYVLAGVLVGLAAGTKYQNVLVAASVALAHVLHWRRDAVATGARLVAAGVVSAMVFLMTTPCIILAFDDFSHDIRTLFESYGSTAIAHGDVTGAWPVGAYLRFYWRECLQPIPFVLALAGLVVLVRRNAAMAAVVLLFPLLMVFSLLRPETHFYRNLLPTQPPLLMLAGIGGIAVIDMLQSRTAPPVSRILTILALGAFLIPSLVPAVRSSARLAQPDSRVLAQTYMRREWPGVRAASELSHPLQWNGVTQSTYVHYLPLYSMDWYYQQGYGLLMANAGRRQQDAWTPEYTPLLEAGEHVASFGGRDSGLLGPRIDVIATGLTTRTLTTHTPQVDLGPLHLAGVRVGRIEKQGSELRMEPGRTIKPGRTLAITVFWLSEDAIPPANYTTFVHFRDQQGRTLVQRDAPPWQGLFPPHTWIPGQVVVERMEMWLPYEVPPGEYQLVMGLYDSVTKDRFPAYAGDTHLDHDEVDMGTVEVVPW